MYHFARFLTARESGKESSELCNGKLLGAGVVAKA